MSLNKFSGNPSLSSLVLLPKGPSCSLAILLIFCKAGLFFIGIVSSFLIVLLKVVPSDINFVEVILVSAGNPPI